MRCICCNNSMNDIEMKRKRLDGEPEDMCFVCLNAINDESTTYKDAQHVTITEYEFGSNGFLKSPD